MKMSQSTSYMQFVESFNRSIKRLCRDLSSRYPGDALIWRTQQRVLLVVDQCPIRAMEEVGPYLHAYKDQILLRDKQFFLETNYDKELRESIDSGKADLVRYIIPKIKVSALNSSVDVLDEYWELILDMLEDYIGYLSCV